MATRVYSNDILFASVLIGIFLLRFRVPALVSIFLLVALSCVNLLLWKRFDSIFLILGANFTYWTASALVAKSGPLDLAEFPIFIEGEGRIFIYYLPLLYYSVARPQHHRIAYATKMLSSLSVAGFALLVVWAVAGKSWPAGDEFGNFFGLLTSHTGAGTFFMVLSVTLLIMGLESGNRRVVLMGSLAVLPIFATGSRQSLLSLTAVLIWYLAKKPKGRSALLIFLIIAVTVLSAHSLIVLSNSNASPVIEFAHRADTLFQLFRSSTWSPGDPMPWKPGQNNIESRMLFWKYAFVRWMESPIFGIGFGRYNDIGIQTYGIPGLIALAQRGERVLVEASAHNSVLHVASETGLVGIALLTALWLAIIRRLRRVESSADNKTLRGFSIACQGLVIAIMAGSLFGHSLAAPSIGLPALMVIGLCLGATRLEDEGQVKNDPNMTPISRPNLNSPHPCMSSKRTVPNISITSRANSSNRLIMNACASFW